MNARRLTTVLSIFMITAVCGLVFASYAEHTQSRNAVHNANGRADTSSGAQWRWQNPLPQGNNLRGVSLVDANTGTLVGDYGTIVRTTDDGNNWTIQSSGTTQTLWAVSFTDSSNGTTVGEVGTILRTTDGGSTWMPQSSGTEETLFGVSFSDSNNGIAVGGTFAQSEILRTTDGGAHWIPQD